MMYSHPSENSGRRPHSQRSSRQWNDYDYRGEERFRLYRNDRDSDHRNDGNGHHRTERKSRSREYSDSPYRIYSKDSLSRDRSRKSPVRRQMSLPDRSSSESKRQRFTKDYEDDYIQGRSPKNKTHRQSPKGFSHSNISNDFKQTLPEREDFRHKQMAKDSRRRHLDQELNIRNQHDDYRPLSPYRNERERPERSWDCSQERTGSLDCFNESYAKPRERKDSPYGAYEDRTRILLNGSSEQPLTSSVTNQSTTVPGEKPTKGFQRFLDVLNKGVNVAMLTKIVTQTSTEFDEQPCSLLSFMESAEGLQSSASARGQQQSRQGNFHWSEQERSQKLASSQPSHRSFSPQLCSLSEQSLQRNEEEQSNLSSSNTSKSLSVTEKVTLAHEDEHKHRQMQGVLQAIGMDLGFEELGQMSHRIQERLYGKKGDDQGHHRRGSNEMDAKRIPSPSRHSRSSSSSSNVSPLARDCSMKKDCYSYQNDVTDLPHIQAHQAGEFVPNSNSRSSTASQDNEKCESDSQERSAASETFYPPMTPVFSPNLSPSVSHAGHQLFLPRLPPILPYPRAPLLNIFPTVLTPNRHLLPQHYTNPQSAPFTLQNTNPAQPLNATQKSKALSRPRCLQVIETKQSG